jgi:hypothetical protein
MTGRRRTLCDFIVSSAAPVSSSGRHEYTVPALTSRTEIRSAVRIHAPAHGKRVRDHVKDVEGHSERISEHGRIQPGRIGRFAEITTICRGLATSTSLRSPISVPYAHR